MTVQSSTGLWSRHGQLGVGRVGRESARDSLYLKLDDSEETLNALWSGALYTDYESNTLNYSVKQVSNERS